MGFKKYERRPTFLDMELRKVMGQSRTQRFLSEVDSAIDWKPIGEMITSLYPVGHSVYGNRAYPPLMLLKALLIQKWFGIASDPELENQINDRFSPRRLSGCLCLILLRIIPFFPGFGPGSGRDSWKMFIMSFFFSFRGKGFPLNRGWRWTHGW